MLDKGMRLTGAWNSGKGFEEPPNIVIPMIEVLKAFPNIPPNSSREDSFNWVMQSLDQIRLASGYCTLSCGSAFFRSSNPC